MYLGSRSLRVTITSLIVGLAGLAVGCGGGSKTVTPPPPVPVSISSVSTSGTSATTATITWTTNVASTSQVDYGTTTNYGSSTPLNSAMVTSHSVSITGLTAGTLYDYRVRSKDNSGVEVVGSNATFTTANPDTTPPTVSITAPTAGASISGTAQLAATASDNVGVVGVQFLVDGNAVGAEDTTSPYTLSWNSTTVANGSHTISARARDAAGNSTTSATVSVTVSNIPDTTPPTVSITSPGAGASVTGITSITATASDNVGVVGVQFLVDATAVGAEVTSSPYNFSWNSASVANGTHVIAARARDAAGNSATSTGVSVSVSNTTTGNDFLRRCASPGVIRCWDFDDAAATDAHVAPPFGETVKRGQVVTNVVADGTGSLQFTVPSQSGADTSGSFSLDFADNLSQQFGEGQEFFLQYRVRYNDVMINTNFTGSNGFKMHITGEGDRPPSAAEPSGFTAFSCTTLELPLQNIEQIGFPRAYHSCGTFQELQVGIPNTFEFLDQNADGCPHYGDQGFPQTEPPCFKFKANEWITIQQHVKVGHWGMFDSTVEYWAADQGQTSRLMVSLADFKLLNDNPTLSKYGKIWLLPYQTNKDQTQVTGTGFVWYDSLIVSTRRIPDPDVTTPNAPDLLRANPQVGAIQLSWRDNSSDEQGFKIERCLGLANSCMATPALFVNVGTVGPGVVTFTDTGLSNTQMYTYRVKAFNANGDSAYTGGACWNGGNPCYSQAQPQ